MQVLEIGMNGITGRKGLCHIARLLDRTQMTKIDFGHNDGVWDHQKSTRRFAQSLSKNKYLTTAIMDHISCEFCVALIFSVARIQHDTRVCAAWTAPGRNRTR
jgi:hypothetical protein